MRASVLMVAAIAAATLWGWVATRDPHHPPDALRTTGAVEACAPDREVATCAVLLGGADWQSAHGPLVLRHGALGRLEMQERRDGVARTLVLDDVALLGGQVEHLLSSSGYTAWPGDHCATWHRPGEPGVFELCKDGGLKVSWVTRDDARSEHAAAVWRGIAELAIERGG